MPEARAACPPVANVAGRFPLTVIHKTPTSGRGSSADQWLLMEGGETSTRDSRRGRESA
jgi:hypothetical protein